MPRLQGPVRAARDPTTLRQCSMPPNARRCQLPIRRVSQKFIFWCFPSNVSHHHIACQHGDTRRGLRVDPEKAHVCRQCEKLLLLLPLQATNNLSSDGAHSTPARADNAYQSLHAFDLDKQRPYQQQYADLYFLRLTKIKPAVDQMASSAWEGTVIGGEEVKRVERVLDVRQGELCWVGGTVYMEMPLKPNILDDVSKDVRAALCPLL